MAITVQEFSELFEAGWIVLELMVVAIWIRDIEDQVADVNPKYLISLYIRKCFYERTIYASSNDLKPRSERPHRTVRNLCRKERGFSMLTKSKASARIITLILSFVLSDLYTNLIQTKEKRCAAL